MDFLFTPEQDEAAALAAEIIGDKATSERMKAVEAAGDRLDRELWATLGDAFDWTELDLIELARVLVEVGRKVAPVPLAVHAADSPFRVWIGASAGRISEARWRPRCCRRLYDASGWCRISTAGR